MFYFNVADTIATTIYFSVSVYIFWLRNDLLLEILQSLRRFEVRRVNAGEVLRMKPSILARVSATHSRKRKDAFIL